MGKNKGEDDARQAMRILAIISIIAFAYLLICDDCSIGRMLLGILSIAAYLCVGGGHS